MDVAVVALGKIGLPLAVQFASAGHRVVGVDIDARTVGAVNAGLEPFPGESGLQVALAAERESGRLRATTDFGEAIPGAEIVVIVVPLFVDEQSGEPDFGWMDAASQSVAEHLSPGTTVIYETTLPVGTTRGRWAPLLQSISGLTEGVDFHVVFSPERVLTGRVFADLRRYPKLIGALSAEGAARARAFYEGSFSFDERPDLPRENGVWDLMSPEAAEMAKLAETTYRDVNIGLANQFAVYAESVGIDVAAVIEACNSQPYSHIHRPGIAVGGHCIPVYPRLYLSTDPSADIVRTAREFNVSMPQRVVDRAVGVLGGVDGLRAVVLGAAYRGGVKETAFSGVFPTVAALADAGAEVRVHDPLYSDVEIEALGFSPYRMGDDVDLIVIQTDHQLYRELGPDDVPGVRLVVDGRNITDGRRWKGVPRIVIGVGVEQHVG